MLPEVPRLGRRCQQIPNASGTTSRASPIRSARRSHMTSCGTGGSFVAAHGGRSPPCPSRMEPFSKYLRLLHVDRTADARRDPPTRRFSLEHDQILDTYDILISPVLASPPVPIGHLGPGSGTARAPHPASALTPPSPQCRTCRGTRDLVAAGSPATDCRSASSSPRVRTRSKSCSTRSQHRAGVTVAAH